MTSGAPVAVGVTGHRLLKNVATIRAGIQHAFGRIERVFRTRRVTIISPLAEGADRLVVLEALSRSDAELIVPLPYDVAEYLEDFESAESKREFLRLLGRAADVVRLSDRKHQDAYAAAGRYVLDHCNVLVAVWDGKNASGTGGTGDIVQQARVRRLPIAWIDAESGGVTYERLETA